MPSITVRKLYQDNRQKLGLSWVAGSSGIDNLISTDEQRPTLALVGHLNFIHPNSIQVFGVAECDYFNALPPDQAHDTLAQLFQLRMSLIIVANGQAVPPALKTACEQNRVPLVTSAQPSPYLMDVLRIYLARVLAVSTVLHGVFLDVLEVGVLITGDSAMGKSELALELISRGNGLVADDAVDLYRINQNTIEGKCPALLQNLLEVRGIGLLDIRAIFGESAVRRRMRLRLIVHLVRKETLEREYERLPYEPLTQDVLGIPVLKVVIQVVAGRNIAVLVEAAVRNTILQLRGIDTYQEFVERHRRAMEHSSDF